MQNIKKKGMTTGLGAMLLSVIAAGVVTTSSYDYKVDAKNEVAQAIQFSKYYDAVVSRVSDDTGYAVSNNADDTVKKQNEKNQVGTPWLTGGDPKSAVCSTKGACGGLFADRDTEFGTMSKFRHLFMPIDAVCSYYSSDKGSWHSLNAISGNIMPCNIFRVRGPLNTNISDDSTKEDVVTMVINTRASQTDQTSEGIEETKDILDINFYIPVNKYVGQGSDSKKKRLMVFVDKLADLLNGKAALSIVKSGKTGTNKIGGFGSGATEYGLGPNILLSNECKESGGKVCYLKVSFITRLHMKGGKGGCTDCLRLDSSNSMNGPITFKKKENKEEDLVDAVLMAWKTEGANKKERENPTADRTISGIITEGDGNKLKIKVEKNEIIQLESETDGKNQLILTPLDVSVKMDDENLMGFKKTDAGAPEEQVEFNVNVANNEIIHSKEKNGAYAVGINRLLDDANSDSGGIEVSDGTQSAILRVGNNKLVGVSMFSGASGYYEIGEVGNGQIKISGTVKRGTEEMKIDLSFSDNQVTGTLNGSIPSNSGIYMVSGGRVYIKRAINTFFNLDIEANPTARIVFDKKVDIAGELQNIIYDLTKTDKVQGSIKSNILRTSNDGVVESDADYFRISKALTEFENKPGPDDCYYDLDPTGCSVTQEDFYKFMHEVPNVEKTIELIKDYTPNKYISYESAWMPIKSKSKYTPGINAPSYYNISYMKDDKPFSYPEVPERVRVLVRATHGYGGCDIPASVRDSDGHFYQEALPAAPTDDDINDTGSGAVYSFNKDGVQIYAPTMAESSKSRHLFYTYDGWGDESVQFHCDIGHVKVIVYKPEQLTGTHNSLMIQSPAMNMTKIIKKSFNYTQAGDTQILTKYLERGIYFLNTEWNTDYYRAPEQYPEDVTLYVRKLGSAGSMEISDGTHWVLGEQPLRRTANTTFDIIQVNAPGTIELYMDVDNVGYIDPDGTFNGRIDVNLTSITTDIH